MKLVAKTLYGTASAVHMLSSFALSVALKTEAIAHFIRLSAAHIESKSKEPNLMQWANRLIEFVDSDNVLDAFRRFESLVRSGIAPDHAFHMVVS